MFKTIGAMIFFKLPVSRGPLCKIQGGMEISELVPDKYRCCAEFGFNKLESVLM